MPRRFLQISLVVGVTVTVVSAYIWSTMRPIEVWKFSRAFGIDH